MLYDKRKLTRQDVFLIVEFKPLSYAGEYAIGITRNLSCGGFSMEAQNFDFEDGEILEFRLKHPHNDLILTVEGEIVWKKQNWYKYEMGARLSNVDDEMKSRILELIFSVRDIQGESLPISGETANYPATEYEEIPAVETGSGCIDEIILHTAGTYTDDFNLAEAGDIEPAGDTGTGTTGEYTDVIKDENAAKAETAKIEAETGTANEQAPGVRIDEVSDEGSEVEPDPAGNVEAGVMSPDIETVEVTDKGTYPEPAEQVESAGVEYEQADEGSVEIIREGAAVDDPVSITHDAVPKYYKTPGKKNRFYVPLMTITVIIVAAVLAVVLGKKGEGPDKPVQTNSERLHTQDTGKNEIVTATRDTGANGQNFRELIEPYTLGPKREKTSQDIPPVDMNRVLKFDPVLTGAQFPGNTSDGKTGELLEAQTAVKKEPVPELILTGKDKPAAINKNIAVIKQTRDSRPAVNRGKTEKARSASETKKTLTPAATAKKTEPADQVTKKTETGNNGEVRGGKKAPVTKVAANTKTPLKPVSAAKKDRIQQAIQPVKETKNKIAERKPVGPVKNNQVVAEAASAEKAKKTGEINPLKSAPLAKKSSIQKAGLPVKDIKNKNAEIKAAGPLKKDQGVSDNSVVKAASAEKAQESAKVKPLQKAEQPVTIAAAANIEKPPVLEKEPPSDTSQAPSKNGEPEQSAEKQSSEKPHKQAAVVKMQKVPRIALVVTRRVKGSDGKLSKRWKQIGNTEKGIPVFMDPRTLTYPTDNTAKLLIKAYVNKKDFVNMLEVNCSQTLLRVLEERNGANPALSAYSSDWRNVLPGNMPIYNAACAKKK